MTTAEIDRVNESCQRAAQQFGGRFYEAYSGLMLLDHGNPGVRAALEQVWYAPEPGSMVIAVWEATLAARAATLH
jgi:hypothetical protein